MKKSFVLYLDQYASIKKLSDEQAGMLLRAMFEFHLGNDFKITDPVVDMAFSFLEETFKRDYSKYMKICDKNKENARKRWDKKNATASDRKKINAKNADSDSGSDTIVIEDSIKNYPQEIKDFTDEYQKYVSDNFGKLAPDTTKAFMTKCYDTIEKLNRIDGFSFDEIFDCIRWGSKDDFWSKQIRALSNLRAKGNNGEKKFVNMMSSFKESGTKPKNKTEARSQENAEVCRRFASG